DTRIVEHPELILAEAVQVAPAEPPTVQVDFLKRLKIEVARQGTGVLLVGSWRREGGVVRARSPQPPGLPRRTAEPRAVEQQAVARAAISPCAAEALGHRARRHFELLGCRAIFHVAVESKLVL